MGLAHHFRKIARTVFAGKYKIGHRTILRWPVRGYPSVVPELSCQGYALGADNASRIGGPHVAL
jgi:hypothetical protein